MFARLVFSLVLGLLMYVPRPIPRPPVDTPPTPEDLPPGGDDVPPIDIPEIEPPGTPIPIPDIEFPEVPKGPGGHLPSVPPTPPPGYEGDWPPASELPDGPPSPPPGVDTDFRERVRDIIRELRNLLGEPGAKRKGAVEAAEEGIKKLEQAPPPASDIETLEA